MSSTCGKEAATAAGVPSSEALSTTNVSVESSRVERSTEARHSSVRSLVLWLTMTMESVCGESTAGPSGACGRDSGGQALAPTLDGAVDSMPWPRDMADEHATCPDPG